MNFLSINPNNSLQVLVDSFIYREREIYQYQLNIDNYTNILASLPLGEIPTEILPYISMETSDLPDFLPIETILLISSYKHRATTAYLIRTEHIEQAKSKQMLESLRSQIPADQLASLVAARVAELQAKELI